MGNYGASITMIQFECQGTSWFWFSVSTTSNPSGLFSLGAFRHPLWNCVVWLVVVAVCLDTLLCAIELFIHINPGGSQCLLLMSNSCKQGSSNVMHYSRPNMIL